MSLLCKAGFFIVWFGLNFYLVHAASVGVGCKVGARVIIQQGVGQILDISVTLRYDASSPLRLS